MSGRQDYEDRRQARIDRLRNASLSAEQRSDAEYNRAHDLVKGIPFGQPNIIGRPALPRLREKSRHAMENAYALSQTADYYKERADAAEKHSAILSDDPRAIQKLQEKLAALEAKRDSVKAANKAARKTGGEQSAWYVLPYLSRDIKAVKDRIAKLEMVDSMPAELIEFDGGEIESDPITNRVIIRFDERQPEEITSALKSHGFKWAPSVSGWQRLRSPHALQIAEKLCDITAAE